MNQAMKKVLDFVTKAGDFGKSKPTKKDIEKHTGIQASMVSSCLLLLERDGLIVTWRSVSPSGSQNPNRYSTSGE